MEKVRIAAEVESAMAEYCNQAPRYAVFDLSEDQLEQLKGIAKSINELHKKNSRIYPSSIIMEVKIHGLDAAAINLRWSDNFTPAEPVIAQVASGFFCIAVKVPGLPEYSTYPCSFMEIQEAIYAALIEDEDLIHEGGPMENVIFIGDDPDEVRAWYYAEYPEMTLKPSFEPSM